MCERIQQRIKNIFRIKAFKEISHVYYMVRRKAFTYNEFLKLLKFNTAVFDASAPDPGGDVCYVLSLLLRWVYLFLISNFILENQIFIFIIYIVANNFS